MHPIERLRWVARAAGEGPALVAQEAAGALAAFGNDPAGLVTACRRLVARQPSSGPMWWLAARVLGAGDPATEAFRAAEELEDDPTPMALAHELPESATALVLGWPEHAGAALRRRGDVRVLAVDSGGEAAGLVRRLTNDGGDAEVVDEAGLGAAVAAADLVVLEASALGPTEFLSIAGARAAAAVAQHADVPVWVVAGVGRVLPARLFDAIASRLDALGQPWELADELVPLELATAVAGPNGLTTTDEAWRRADCPIAPELLKETQ
jgi:hypothetical protein